MELAKLTGTEKQVAWAEDLRDYAMQGLDALMRLGIERCEEKLADGKGSREDADRAIAAAQAQIEVVREAANAHTDASWWIDNLADPNPSHKGRTINIPSCGERLIGVIKREIKARS